MTLGRAENLPEGLRRWLDHIQASERSGQRIHEYAREHGLKQKSLYNAKTRLIKRGILKSRSKPVTFERVEVASNSPRFGIRVQMPNGLVVELDVGFDAGGLGDLLRAVKAL
ncbi:MAG: IS66 family insertion sequence element accessory protein TnpA [Gammaproteobacteria bacterium]